MTAAGPLPSSVAAGVEQVRERIEAACQRAGRASSEVTLVAVTKTHFASVVAQAVAAGVRDIGENYVQEGASKIAELESTLAEMGLPPPVRHFIGQLQRNKVRAALTAFDVFHAIDSERLVEAIERASPGLPVPCFIQVNLAGEATKGGVAPVGIPAIVERMRTSPAVQVLGLMTVPPAGPAEASRPWFRQLRVLASENGLSHCSMGMTGDFEVAIEEGATHVRVGRAIFGERQR